MSAAVPTFRQILSETTLIINAHSRHFLALTILFILPVSFSAVIFSSLLHPTSIHSHYQKSLYFFFSASDNTPQTLLPIIYILFVYSFPICSTASITYSTFHGFYGKPVEFIDSMKSILSSFFPLLATLVVMQIIMGLIMFAFMGLMLLVHHSVNSLFFVLLIAILLAGVLIYLQSEWYLSNVVVVVESRWGFSPLKRSSYLVKGLKRVVFSMLIFFGFFVVLLSMLCSSLVANGGGIEGWLSWEVVLLTIVYTGCLTIVSLYSIAGNTVLFIHCKAMHGEFDGEYVSLPCEDEKVPYVNVV
ncbi:hypothetical protein BUALT_Bualt17G0075700 [Buddleja alternifolia]|uniref:Uncharacterized protein n=1 Tax=Buddleja alternifolia TaxID=168488 RepID=A0AAV6WHE9_9LAMI|nr:hypothetical protein BUALT_Bualt17G0075700 [Buddleja alternifolia]